MATKIWVLNVPNADRMTFSSFAFSPDSSLLAFGSSAHGCVELWGWDRPNSLAEEVAARIDPDFFAKQRRARREAEERQAAFIKEEERKAALANERVANILKDAVARELKARVNTVSEDMTTLRNGAAFNRFIKSLKVYATKKEIILVSDIDTKNWVDVGICFPLLVRVFDKDGECLTHFVTEERFTGSNRIHDNFVTMMGRIRDLPDEQRRKLGYFPPGGILKRCVLA